jgi:tetratricopeptide (TPR) repeat protein
MQRIALAIFLALSGASARAADSRAAVRLEIFEAQGEEVSLPPNATPEKIERVATAYRQVVERHPDSAAAENALAEFLWKHGAPREAFAHWQSAQRIEPGNAEAANSLGGAYLSIGHARESAEQFRRAVQLERGKALYHFNLANVEYMLRHDLTAAWQIDANELLRRALLEFREASRLAPGNADYARAYAETFYGIPDPDWRDAQAAWQHVLEVSHDKDFAYLHLARVSLNRGDKASVFEFLAKVTSPKHDDLMRKLRARAEALQ